MNTCSSSVPFGTHCIWAGYKMYIFGQVPSYLLKFQEYKKRSLLALSELIHLATLHRVQHIKRSIQRHVAIRRNQEHQESPSKISDSYIVDC